MKIDEMIRPGPDRTILFASVVISENQWFQRGFFRSVLIPDSVRLLPKQTCGVDAAIGAVLRGGAGRHAFGGRDPCLAVADVDHSEVSELRTFVRNEDAFCGAKYDQLHRINLRDEKR